MLAELEAFVTDALHELIRVRLVFALSLVENAKSVFCGFETLDGVAYDLQWSPYGRSGTDITCQ